MIHAALLLACAAVAVLATPAVHLDQEGRAGELVALVGAAVCAAVLAGVACGLWVPLPD